MSDNKSGKLVPLRKAVDEDLVATLRYWLEAAERGEVTGVVLLGNTPGDTIRWACGGNMPIGTAMHAFEYFKLRNLQDD